MILRYGEFITEKFIKYINFGDEKLIPMDLVNDPKYKSLIYSTPTDKSVKELNKILRDNKDGTIKLYHGTSPKIDILESGLLTTKNNTKKSMQSETGYVYLSVYPESAKKFGNMAYSISDAIVYEVIVPISFIKVDTDQLKNIRMFGENNNIGSTLADSILYGKGVRIKGDIPPFMIKKYK